MSVVADTLLQYLIQYGLAGIVLYIFYKLLSNELRDLKEAVNRLNDTIIRLNEKVSK